MKNQETEEVMQEILKSHNVSEYVSEYMTGFSKHIDHRLERDEKVRVLELCMGYLVQRGKIFDSMDRAKKAIKHLELGDAGTVLNSVYLGVPDDYVEIVKEKLLRLGGESWCLLMLMDEHMGYPYPDTYIP